MEAPPAGRGQDAFAPSEVPTCLCEGSEERHHFHREARGSARATGHLRRPNKEPVYLRAGQGWTLLQGADGAWLEFTVPCGEETADVLVWWGYSGVAVEDSPPNATNNPPASVACPVTRTLSKSVSDPDNDLASVRWLVDGVLMADGITTMAFTAPHEMTLIARDARGATRTARKTVACQ